MEARPASATPETIAGFRGRSLESRIEESERVKAQYASRLPVIVTLSSSRSARSLLGSSDLPALDKFKYLVPGDFTVGQLIYVIRRRMKVAPETALFLYCAAALPSSTTLVQELYAQFKDLDGFLYLTFQGESSFGGGGASA